MKSSKKIELVKAEVVNATPAGQEPKPEFPGKVKTRGTGAATKGTHSSDKLG